jgi:hypothetical protein
VKPISKEVKPSDEWWCETCGTKPDEPMSRPDMLKHLQERHEIDTKNLKGKREMLMHLGGDTWFSYQWAFTFDTLKGEVKLTNSTTQPRAKDDMMRFL